MNQVRYVLCVDDEPLLLEGLERTLRESFEVVTETKPLAALALLERKEHDFVAIVSDMRMPLMDGAKFLACAAEIAPNSTRVLLTGHAELNAAIAAVNTGRIFRFLCKPCAPNELVTALEAAAEQHQLRNSEKQLLEQTLTGSVRLLSDVLMLGRADVWRFELAACLNMIGCVSLPEEMANRALSGAALDEQEARAFAEHPLVAHRLLQNIPRFEDIAEMLKLQVETVRAGAEPSPDVALGARLLRVARAVERLVAQGVSESDAIAKLIPTASGQELELFKLLAEFRPLSLAGELKELRVGQMTAQMALEDDVKTKTGVVVVPGGKQLTQVLLERLIRFSRAGVLVEPIRVRVPTVVS